MVYLGQIPSDEVVPSRQLTPRQPADRNASEYPKAPEHRNSRTYHADIGIVVRPSPRSKTESRYPEPLHPRTTTRKRSTSRRRARRIADFTDDDSSASSDNHSLGSAVVMDDGDDHTSVTSDGIHRSVAERGKLRRRESLSLVKPSHREHLSSLNQQFVINNYEDLITPTRRVQMYSNSSHLPGKRLGLYDHDISTPVLLHRPRSSSRGRVDNLTEPLYPSDINEILIPSDNNSFSYLRERLRESSNRERTVPRRVEALERTGHPNKFTSELQRMSFYDDGHLDRDDPTGARSSDTSPKKETKAASTFEVINYELWRFEKEGEDWTDCTRYRVSASQKEIAKIARSRSKSGELTSQLQKMVQLLRRQIDRLVHNKYEETGVHWELVWFEELRVTIKGGRRSVLSFTVVVARVDRNQDTRAMGSRPLPGHLDSRTKRVILENQTDLVRDKKNKKKGLIFSKSTQEQQEPDPFGVSKLFAPNGKPLEVGRTSLFDDASLPTRVSKDDLIGRGKLKRQNGNHSHSDKSGQITDLPGTDYISGARTAEIPDGVDFDGVFLTDKQKGKRIPRKAYNSLQFGLLHEPSKNDKSGTQSCASSAVSENCAYMRQELSEQGALLTKTTEREQAVSDTSEQDDSEPEFIAFIGQSIEKRPVGSKAVFPGAKPEVKEHSVKKNDEADITICVAATEVDAATAVEPAENFIETDELSNLKPVEESTEKAEPLTVKTGQGAREDSEPLSFNPTVESTEDHLLLRRTYLADKPETAEEAGTEDLHSQGGESRKPEQAQLVEIGAVQAEDAHGRDGAGQKKILPQGGSRRLSGSRNFAQASSPWHSRLHFAHGSRPHVSRFELDPAAIGGSSTILDRLKRQIESNLDRRVLWWPLNKPREECGQNETRILWECTCGATFTTNVSNEAAESFYRMMKITAHAPALPPLLPTYQNQASRGKSSGSQSASSSTFSSGRRGSLGAVAEGNDNVQTSNDKSLRKKDIPEQLPDKFLHWCVKSRTATTRVVELEMRDLKDETLVPKLLAVYNSLTRFRGWLTFTSCAGVRFVKFRKLSLKTDLVSNIKDGLPARPHPEYEYDFITPPAPEEEFMEWLQAIIAARIEHPRCPEVRAICNVLRHIPKKVNGKMTAFNGYGLYGLSAYCFWKAVLALTISSIPSLVFMIRWLIGHEGDWQNALAWLTVTYTVVNILVWQQDRWSLDRARP